MNIDRPNRRVEIGSTWYRRSAQRTALNTEVKLLMLSHAFNDLDCVAVEFRTHFFNHTSRRAIERLGAKLDGVLRNHQINRHSAAPDTLRDTCVYKAGLNPRMFRILFHSPQTTIRRTPRSLSTNLEMRDHQLLIRPVMSTP